MKKFQITFEVTLDGDYVDNPTDFWDMEAALKQTDKCITTVKTLGWSDETGLGIGNPTLESTITQTNNI